MNIGLYFGAFNPVHDGHMKVANYVLNNSDLDIVWLVLTPQSPHKVNSTLIDYNHRYKMLEIVCKKYKNIFFSNYNDLSKKLKNVAFVFCSLKILFCALFQF